MGVVDPELRRKFARLVAGIVLTDDELDPREERFLGRLFDRLGVGAGERALIRPAVDGEDAVRAIRDLPESLRDEALSMLIEAASVDDRLAEEERHYLEVVAAAMGLDEEELDRRIDLQFNSN